ncbi:exo-beta-N-acetylmuramidase NamZ domain-containing protein [Fodinibius sp.]|uniref:exo-beta-N-acetylmuramidase NamZ family protein n=1 Tax=Fodinibius sp. TaxID=1872440 RepID=UPI003564BDBC
MYLRSLLLLLTVCTYACQSQLPGSHSGVKVGAQVLIDEHLGELQGKRVGLVMNPTARVEDKHMLDTLLASDVNVTALFAAEHGFRGDAGAGETIEDGVDQATGLPVFSLYGETRKPTEEMLEEVDLLLFDMQDVGARFYTYNVTLGNIIEAASAHGVPVWVLDRPNPAGGNYISGWMLQDKHRSFVGGYPIPMAHGMTLGELARMMVGEQWIEHAEKSTLRVIPMEGWKRTMKWRETGLEWIPPSPNLPTFRHAYIYLGTVLFEGVNISEGRGTPDPFMMIGSPSSTLTTSHIAPLRRTFEGVNIERVSFRPRSIPGKAPNPKFEGERCHGVELQITDINRVDPVVLGVELLATMLDATPNAELSGFIEKLSGIDRSELLQQLEDGSYREQWEKTAQQFSQQRSEYLLYE